MNIEHRNMDFNKLTIIAGPCLIEGEKMLFEVAEILVKAIENKNINFIFKGSYRKANRTSVGSFQGIGDEKALSLLAEIRKTYGVPVITDFHSVEEIKKYAEMVDVVQIPAFLARQTELIEAAAKSGKVVNIKKAQFMAPEDALKAAQKSVNAGNDKVLITERGTCFGYHDLVVDFRGIATLKQSQFPVIYDATHSLQQPSVGSESGGKPEFLLPLAKAAVAVGVNGLFFETHPEPKTAKSDSATQLKLSKAPAFIETIYELYNFVNKSK